MELLHPSPPSVITETVDIDIPAPYLFLLSPAREKSLRGGRGSGKSWQVARALVGRAVAEPIRVLCGREIQNSLADSVHKLLVDQIKLLGFKDYFKVSEDSLTSRAGAEFMFKGLKHNIDNIKGLEGVDVAWLEEAEKISQRTWDKLEPSIRKRGSEIWSTWNPDLETDATYLRYVKNPAPYMVVREVSWRDNPYFFQTELVEQMKFMRRNNPERYNHIWEGKCRTYSEAQILKGRYRIEAMPDPEGENPLYGLDFGFANDPSAGVRMFLYPGDHGGMKLYITHELYEHHLEINHTGAKVVEKLPGAAEHTIRADSARPEVISYIVNHDNLDMRSVEKWPGSVEEGVMFLLSLEEIIIHPRCVNAIREAGLWSYAVDKNTGDVQPKVAPGHDHIWDGVRYAAQPVIRSSENEDGMIRHLAAQVSEKRKLEAEQAAKEKEGRA